MQHTTFNYICMASSQLSNTWFTYTMGHELKLGESLAR
jgi:hypothetical protein